jgi:hypothetical protein
MMGGTGIEVPCLEDGEEPITGFFTTRLVKASSIAEAEEIAKEMVLRDWTSGEYASTNRGAPPVVRIEAAHETSWWRLFRFRNTGYTFY